LVEALRQHLAVYALEPAGSPSPAAGGVEVVVEEDLPALSAAVEVAAYRVATEAVANAVRHSGCGRCEVRVGVGDGGLKLEVTDDGAGIPSGTAPHVGLQSMRERTAEIGGRFEISTSSSGTAVRAWFPLLAAGHGGEA
jgi:signal transduction histidine kinase